MIGTIVRQLGELVPWFPSRVDRPELLDLPGQDPALLAGNLDDLRRVNYWLGGTRLTLRAVGRVTAGLRPGSELSVLDVATGGGDIPRALERWAHQRGLDSRIVATDVSMEILRLARADVGRPGSARKASSQPNFAAADGRCLPFADRSFDVAICSLVIHHLKPADAVAMLREMRRVSRRGIVVNDLVRSWVGYLGAWLLTRTLTRNPLTRHDGPLSARRAYTRAELADLARQAGLGPVDFDGFLGYRVAMTARALR